MRRLVTRHGTETDIEARILVAGARTHVDEAALASACGAPGARVDWGRVESLASFHGVTPLLYASLARNAPQMVPPPVLRRMRDRARANVPHSLFLSSELVRLMPRFAAKGIPAVAFKGPVLAAYAYRDLTAREFTDLDIFVPKESIVAASRVILSEGYISSDGETERAIEAAVRRDGEVAFLQASHYTFFRPDGRSRVDLQWRMAQRYFAFTLDRRNAWLNRLSYLSLGGVEIPTFSPTDTLLVLCVHGSKHRWEKLKWLCDVAEMLREHGAAVDWEELARTAAEQGAERMVGLGLALARDVLDATVPPELVAATRTDRGVPGLVRELRGTLFATEREQPTRLEEAAYTLRLADRWQDRVRFAARYVSQSIGRVLSPTAADRALLPASRRLPFADYLIRPCRLSVQYTILGGRWLRQRALVRTAGGGVFHSRQKRTGSPVEQGDARCSLPTSAMDPGRRRSPGR